MGSSSQQLYSLSWGEFGSSLTSSVQLLRGQADLVDVTLAAGGRTFAAHKIVLSAASPFLLELLKNTPCHHPVVMLAGIDPEDLETILEFVYKGEVSVDPAQMPSLLQAAHCLSIHGLSPPTMFTQNGEVIPPSLGPECTSPVGEEPISSYLPIQKSKKRRKSSSSTSSSIGKWARSDHGEIDEKSQDGRSVEYDQTKEAEVESHDGIVPGDDLKSRGVSEQPAICPLCGVTLRQSRNLRRHLAQLHFSTGSTVKSSSMRFRRPKTEPPTELHGHSLSPGSVVEGFGIDNSCRFPRTNENTDLSTSTSIPSTASSGASNIISPNNPSDGKSNRHETPTSNNVSPGMLNYSLPNLRSSSSLRSSANVFHDGLMLRAGLAYHDRSRRYNTHTRRTDAI